MIAWYVHLDGHDADFPGGLARREGRNHPSRIGAENQEEVERMSGLRLVLIIVGTAYAILVILLILNYLLAIPGHL